MTETGKENANKPCVDMILSWVNHWFFLFKNSNKIFDTKIFLV